MQISDNGIVSFDIGFSSRTTSLLPGSTHTSLIAPFWSDVDVRRHGKVFYQAHTESESGYVKRASDDVRDMMGGQFTEFTAGWVLVVTWDKVPQSPDGSIGFSDSHSFKVRGLFHLNCHVVNLKYCVL